jgi:hypothetical protein
MASTGSRLGHGEWESSSIYHKLIFLFQCLLEPRARDGVYMCSEPRIFRKGAGFAASTSGAILEPLVHRQTASEVQSAPFSRVGQVAREIAGRVS